MPRNPLLSRTSVKGAPKVKRLRIRTSFGFRSNRKALREFNGRKYVRLGSFNSRLKSVALKIKDKQKAKGYYALLVKSGNNYQVWTARGEK